MPGGGVGTDSVSQLARRAYVWTLQPPSVTEALNEQMRHRTHGTSSQLPAAAAAAAVCTVRSRRAHCNQFDPPPRC